MSWLTLQQPATPAFPCKFSIAYLYFAAHRDHRWAAFDLHSFETIVVVVRVLRLGRDNTAIIRVVNYQVRVASDGDRAFAWEKPKKFRSSSAGSIHKAIQIQTPSLHSIRIQEVHAFF